MLRIMLYVSFSICFISSTAQAAFMQAEVNTISSSTGTQQTEHPKNKFHLTQDSSLENKLTYSSNAELLKLFKTESPESINIALSLMDKEQAGRIFNKLNAADSAGLMEYLDPNLIATITPHLDPKYASQLFNYFGDSFTNTLLKKLGPKTTQDIASHLPQSTLSSIASKVDKDLASTLLSYNVSESFFDSIVNMFSTDFLKKTLKSSRLTDNLVGSIFFDGDESSTKYELKSFTKNGTDSKLGKEISNNKGLLKVALNNDTLMNIGESLATPHNEMIKENIDKKVLKEQLEARNIDPQEFKQKWKKRDFSYFASLLDKI